MDRGSLCDLFCFNYEKLRLPNRQHKGRTTQEKKHANLIDISPLLSNYIDLQVRLFNEPFFSKVPKFFEKPAPLVERCIYIFLNSPNFRVQANDFVR